MAEISKQALQVANNTDFPDNSTGYITPAILRSYNTDVIDSTVNQTVYTADSASLKSSITQLNTFTASQQPSFTALNAFTASQLTINSGVNAATQSLSASIAVVSNEVDVLQTWSSSVNEIIEDNVSKGYATRFNFAGLITASIVQNVNGNIADITVNSDPSAASTASFNQFTQSINTYTASLKQAISVSGADASILGNLNVSGTINAYEIHTIIESSSVIFSSGSNVLGDASIDTQTLHGTVNLPDGDLNVQAGNVNVTGNITVTGNVDGVDVSTFYSNTNAFTTSVNTKFDTIGALTGSYATTGSNTFTGKQIITGTENGLAITGSSGYVDLSGYNAHVSMYTGTGSIRFYSGSALGNGASDLGTYVNMQTNPSNGALAISAYPANNHFVDFDVAQTASLFTAPIKGMSGTLQIGSNTVLTGSLTISSSATNDLIVSGNIVVGGFAFPSITISGSTGIGQTSVAAAAISFASGSTAGGTTTGMTGVFGKQIASNYIPFGGFIGISGNPAQTGTPTLASVTSPSILGQSPGAGQFYPAISLQPSASYTDGTVSVLKPLNVSGSATITGSVVGNVNALTITSQTASMDLSKSNFFTLQMAEGTSTHIVATNIRPGQTINLRLNQATSSLGTISFPSYFDFAGGIPASASAVLSATDILSFVTFNTSSIYSTIVKNLS